MSKATPTERLFQTDRYGKPTLFENGDLVRYNAGDSLRSDWRAVTITKLDFEGDFEGVNHDEEIVLLNVNDVEKA